MYKWQSSSPIKEQPLEILACFRIARDVSSFLGFMNFYATYIPWFEERAAPLRELAKLDMQSNIEPLMKEEHFKAREDLIMAILSDPCLARFDYKKRPYLLADFSKRGFGCNLFQTADAAASMAAMRREMEGGNCEFLKPNSNLMLKSIGFGSRRKKGREVDLHSGLPWIGP